MVQFKSNFLNPEKSPYATAVSVQKCLRAGGKHNDLDNVGYTKRHHTFFEMLGNFSFGLYDKQEAIRQAWSFLAHDLALPVQRLAVTVLQGDTETADIWHRDIGLPRDRVRLCSSEDNFWSMGPEGPCGPCTEIFWDTGDTSSEDSRWLEIWNLVFMQYHRHADGRLDDLPSLCIDTGMGLERLASVVQGKSDNFETDLFLPITSSIQQLLQQHALPTVNALTPNVKIIADHLRSASFLIADGVIPSNVSRGYVLRRIIRRALKAAHELQLPSLSFASLYPSLLHSLSSCNHPTLFARQNMIQAIIQQEEENFRTALDKGLQVLEQITNKISDDKRVPAYTVFDLYATYGFPMDLTAMIGQSKGWQVDIEGAEAILQTQRIENRQTWKTVTRQSTQDIFQEWQQQCVQNTFVGNRSQETESKVVAVHYIDDITAQVVIEPSPFYGHGGGQTPDQGFLQGASSACYKVVAIQQPYGATTVLTIKQTLSNDTVDVNSGFLADLDVGNTVTAKVDSKHRELVTAHHSATHLLNASLRHTLDENIVQAGSVVDNDRLRFDFTYKHALTSQQICAVEDKVNEIALANVKVSDVMLPLSVAKEKGAIATFTEKYGDTVRVIQMGDHSMELCGGTHVKETRDVYPFKIISECSVAAGTRRIEAVAGRACVRYLQGNLQTLQMIATSLKVEPEEVESRVRKLGTQLKEQKHTIEVVSEHLARVNIGLEPVIVKTMSAVRCMLHVLDASMDGTYVKRRAHIVRAEQPDFVHILLCRDICVIALNSAYCHNVYAKQILQKLFVHLNGKGGGQQELAQGKLDTEIDPSQALRYSAIIAEIHV